MMIRTALPFFLGAALGPGLLARAAVTATIPIPTTLLPVSPAQPSTALTLNPQPTIVVGSPQIPDNPTAFNAINENTPDSPLAGVVSVYAAATTSNPESTNRL